MAKTDKATTRIKRMIARLKTPEEVEEVQRYAYKRARDLGRRLRKDANDKRFEELALKSNVDQKIEYKVGPGYLAHDWLRLGETYTVSSAHRGRKHYGLWLTPSSGGNNVWLPRFRSTDLVPVTDKDRTPEAKRRASAKEKRGNEIIDALTRAGGQR